MENGNVKLFVVDNLIFFLYMSVFHFFVVVHLFPLERNQCDNAHKLRLIKPYLPWFPPPIVFAVIQKVF